MNVGSKSTEGWFKSELQHPKLRGHLLEVVAIGFFFVTGEGLEDRGGHSGSRGEPGSVEVSNRLQHSALEGWQGQVVPPRGHSQFKKLERERVFAE